LMPRKFGDVMRAGHRAFGGAIAAADADAAAGRVQERGRLPDVNTHGLQR
jgi:hypothetical protein